MQNCFLQNLLYNIPGFERCIAVCKKIFHIFGYRFSKSIFPQQLYDVSLHYSTRRGNSPSENPVINNNEE